MPGIDNSLCACIIVCINLDLIQVFVTRDSSYFSAGININLMMDDNTTPAEGTGEEAPKETSTEEAPKETSTKESSE